MFLYVICPTRTTVHCHRVTKNYKRFVVKREWKKKNLQKHYERIKNASNKNTLHSEIEITNCKKKINK